MNSRKVGNQVLTLSASGWTYDFTFVLYDYETQSMWCPQGSGSGIEDHFLSIAGVYAGERLEPVPFDLLSWERWVELHPNTMVLG